MDRAEYRMNGNAAAHLQEDTAPWPHVLQALQIGAKLPQEGARAILKPLFYLIWEKAGQQSSGPCDAYANELACIVDTLQRAVDGLLAMNIGEKNINFVKETHMLSMVDMSEDATLQGIKKALWWMKEP